MRPLWIAFAALLSASRPCWSATGRTGGILLQQPFGPRPFALGQAYSALGDDAFAMAYNPASLARLQESQSALQLIQGIEDVKLGYGVFATPLNQSHAFGAALGYLDAGKIDIYDDSTRLLGTSSLQRDLLLEVGYAHGFRAGSGRFNLGTSAKLLRSQIVEEMTATGYAGSFGVIYEHPALGGTGSLALVAANVGPAIKYSGGAATGEADPLPLTAKAGAGFSRNVFDGDKVGVAVEYAQVFHDDDAFPAAGIEYSYRNLAILRLGVRFGESDGGLRMGMGFQVKGVSIDYAIGLMQTFNHVHQMSINYRFKIPGIKYRKDADGFESFIRRVNDLISEERFFDAADEVDRLRALAPDRRDIFELGDSISRKMRQILDDAIAAPSAPPRHAYALGFKAYKEQSWKEAASRLSEALGREPASDEIPKYLERARIQANQERKQADLQQKARIGTLFELASKAHEAGGSARALKIIDEILRLGPYQPAESLRSRLIKAAARNGRKKNRPMARQAAPNKKVIDARQPSPEEMKRAERLYYEGLRLYLENDPAAAMEKLSEGVRLDPSNDSLRLSLESIRKGTSPGGRP